MKKKLTPKQQINEELARRSFNQKAKGVIKSTNPPHEVAELVIDFLCECSNEECRERVPLTIKQYEAVHAKPATFILVNGHEQLSVDRVKSKASSFTIVDKPALKAAAD